MKYAFQKLYVLIIFLSLMIQHELTELSEVSLRQMRIAHPPANCQNPNNCVLGLLFEVDLLFLRLSYSLHLYSIRADSWLSNQMGCYWVSLMPYFGDALGIASLATKHRSPRNTNVEIVPST